MDLFDIAAKITLDTSEYENGLNESEKSASTFGKRLKDAFKVGAAAIGTVTAATGAMATALVSSTGNVAAYGDNIDKMSQKMGLSVEAYQEWDAILQHSGSSVDSMSRSMVTLQKKAVDDAKAFEKLGLSQEEVANMSTEDLFAATISGLQGMEEGAERTALASELLGGAAKELGPLLNTSAEETEAMRKRVHELGGVMSEEAVKASAAYQDSLQDMQTAFSGLSRGLVSDFLPSITSVMDGLTEIFAGNGEAGIQMISSGIDALVGNITEKLPEFANVALGIIESIATAIIDNLPKITESAMAIMMELITYLVNSLPDLVDVGLQMIITLADAILESLPTLIPAIVDVVTTIATKLTEPDMLTQIIDAAIQITLAIMTGLLDALPQLVEAVIQIVVNLAETLINNAPKILEAIGQVLAGVFEAFSVVGVELVRPFAQAWSGIKQEFSSVGSFFGGVWQSVKNAFGSVATWFGSTFAMAWNAVKKVFSKGGEIFEGIKGGIENTFKTVVNAIIDGINTVIAIPFNAINNFLKTLRNVNILGVTPFSWIKTFGVPVIPKLAKGGIVDTPTLLEAGELYKPEAIVPLDKLWKEMHNMWEDYSQNATAANVTINVYPSADMDEEQLANMVMDRMQKAIDRRVAVF